jgi:uncharacterized integral membrane protein
LLARTRSEQEADDVVHQIANRLTALNLDDVVTRASPVAGLPTDSKGRVNAAMGSERDGEAPGTELTPASEATTNVSPRTSSERDWLRTRTSAVWTSVVVLVASLVLVIIFILQNPQDVSVSFLIFDGQLPLGVALLVSATLGGVIVLAAAAARVVQLRRTRRRRDGPYSA